VGSRGSQRSRGAAAVLSRSAGPVLVLRVEGSDTESEAITRAATTLAAGGLVIYPTDTLYALGCAAADGAACTRVRAAKGRDENKPLPLVAADEDAVRGLVEGWSRGASRLAARFWPGPLTLVLRAGAGLPRAVTLGAGTVAVRVPGLALTRALCRAAGPLVSTSANRSGEKAPETCQEAVASVGDRALLALDGGPGRDLPSTIVDASGLEPRLLRAGAVPWDDVLAAWHAVG
jgi:L-threonylcarbamoyladenylate synthase